VFEFVFSGNFACLFFSDGKGLGLSMMGMCFEVVFFCVGGGGML
jgi:hypothetical protein